MINRKKYIATSLFSIKLSKFLAKSLRILIKLRKHFSKDSRVMPK